MSRIVRGLMLVVVGIYVACFGALTYGGFTAPSIPYAGSVPFTVDQIVRTDDAGALQPGDDIIRFNGQPIFTCMYLGAYTPIYKAPRNQEIPVTYWRTDLNSPRGGTLQETTVVLRNLSFQDFVGRGLGYLVGAVFLVVGAYFLIFRWPQLRWFLLACLGSSLLLAAVPESSHFRAPFGVAYWIGMPIWAICVTVGLSEWPLNQLHRRIPRLLIAITTLVGVISIVTNSVGWMGANCAIPTFDNLVMVRAIGDNQIPQGLLFNFRLISSFVMTFLPFVSLGYLLISAYRLSANNRFIRTQVRTLLWVHSFVAVVQVGLSYIPIWLGLRFSLFTIAPYLLSVISIFLPITWAVVGFRSTIMGVEQFLSRTFLTLLLVVSSVMLMLAAFEGVYLWNSNPDPALVTLVALIPFLLFNVLLRKPSERLVDLVLYGHHYDYDETLNMLMHDLNVSQDVQSIGRVLTFNIPEALLVDCAAFWAKTPEGELVLVDTWNVSREILPTKLLENQLEVDAETSIIVHKEPFRLPNSDVKWYLTVKLTRGAVLEGVLFLGPKLRLASYSPKDTRVLLSLANWIGGKLAGWRLTEIEIKQEREQVLMLVEHEAGIRAQVAEELHDRGITALSLVRRLVEQQQSPEVVRGALQQVIDDLRLLTSSHLKPSGLDFGLIAGLDALVRDYSQVGANIELDSAVPDKIWSSLSDRQTREVFFVLREAVTNAFKADNQASIMLRVVKDEEFLHFSVNDTGPGFDIDKASTNKVLHHGLAIMKARARNIEADLMIDTMPGVGTSVCITVPLTGIVVEDVPV
jgi:signal transduction histidine kinase